MKFIHIKKYEIGLRFYRGDFVGLLGPGKHVIFDPLGRTEIDVVDGRAVYLRHADLDVIVKSGAGRQGRRVRADRHAAGPRLDRRPVQRDSRSGPARALGRATAAFASRSSTSSRCSRARATRN